VNRKVTKRMNSSKKKSVGVTSYVVRDVERRQYLNESSARGGRWGRFGEASLFSNEWDAARRVIVINSGEGRDRAVVVPIVLRR